MEITVTRDMKGAKSLDEVRRGLEVIARRKAERAGAELGTLKSEHVDKKGNLIEQVWTATKRPEAEAKAD